MNSSELLFDRSYDMQEGWIKAKLFERVIARSIDFLIVIALFELIPRAGFLAGLGYLLIADGLFDGRSVGKKVIGLKVVFDSDKDTAVNCTYRESALRNSPLAAGYVLAGILGIVPLLGWILSFAVIAVILIFESLVMIGSEDDMRLGDEIAKTRVVMFKEGGENVS